MKVFVSGQIKDVKSIRNIQAKLRQAGHAITHDWTAAESQKSITTTQDKPEDIEETGRRAQQILKACQAKFTNIKSSAMYSQ